MNALLAVALMGLVVYEAPPKVSEFLDSDAFVRVLHGPVGSSKSSGCVSEIMRRALEQAPFNGIRDTRWAVVRNTYRELEDTTRRTFDQWLGPFGKWREKDFAFDVDLPLRDGTRLKFEVLFRALDRPEDVKKLLSLELTGAYINELRELPKAILDGLTMRVGRFPSKKDGGPTWYGVWADTNPWAMTSEYAELFEKPPEGFELFRQPSGLADNAENIENLPDGYYRKMMAGKDKEWVAEYVEGKNPKADKGSIYGEWLAGLKLLNYAHPTDGVYASFDLGFSDSTAIWFWRVGADGIPDVIDWYENSGQSASHFIGILNARKYQYAKIFLPHDAKAQTHQTGKSTFEIYEEAFKGRVTLTPSLSVDDGIGAGRWLLEQPVRIHTRCEEGVKRLKAYKFGWDVKNKIYTKTPVHDWTSHSADAWRYVSIVAQAVWKMTRPAPKPAPFVVGPIRVTLDQLEYENQTTNDKRRL